MTSAHVFIPNDIRLPIDKRELFWPSRLFFLDDSWGNHSALYAKWNIPEDLVCFTADIREADYMILPYSINRYFGHGLGSCLEEYNSMCRKHNLLAFAGISGDWGRKFKEFDHIVYFRMGGFRLQLSARNKGLPFALSDQVKTVAPGGMPTPRPYQVKPTVGFCGHATKGWWRRIQESLKFVLENAKRFLQNPGRTDWEPVFPSAFVRATLLDSLVRNPSIETNFILRNRYRAGASTAGQLEKTTREYYENMLASDYILCVRGGGNFSVRLYETLMMGRIPVFVNTDCLLPMAEWVNWQDHVVWVEWSERHRLAERILEFHRQLSPDQFLELQIRNRKFWLEKLTLRGVFEYLNHQAHHEPASA